MTGRQFIACCDANKLFRTSRRDRMKDKTITRSCGAVIGSAGAIARRAAPKQSQKNGSQPVNIYLLDPLDPFDLPWPGAGNPHASPPPSHSALRACHWPCALGLPS